MTLSEALRAYRKEHRLAQKELAAKIGISLKHYACIEGGSAHPSSTVLSTICRITDIKQNFYLGGEE